MLWFKIWCGLFLLSIILHAITCWYVKSANALIKFIILGCICGIYAMILLFQNWGFSTEFISGTLAFAFSCELYIFVFNFVGTSVSVSIVLKTLNKDIKISELQSDYSGKAMVTSRINRLQKNHLLTPTPQGLQISQKGGRLVSKFNKFHEFFRLQETINP